MTKRIMSGMRPTGKLHLGHYLGVIKNWVELQNQYECFYQVADWHALTTKYDKTENLSQDVLAERDPTLKDMAKILKTKEGVGTQINYGLMGYPVLMAADILLFNADYVPVGIDQVAHIELTRDIMRRFNNIYKTDYFKEPQPLLNECSLICGLDGNKMGKSFNNDIKISDTEEITTKKIMTAITDRSRLRKDDLGHPDECEVAFKYWNIFGDKEGIQTVRCECEKGLRGCADCKRQLAKVINEKLSPIREKRRYYEEHPEIVYEIIKTGSEKARKVAQQTIKDVRKLVKMY